MDECYIGEIRMFTGEYAPVGWELCNGMKLSINQYPALYSLIGTTYGGDGQTFFALPDLRGRIPIHNSSNYPLGSYVGTETEILIENQLPIHTHTVKGNSNQGDAISSSPANNLWGYTSFASYQSYNAASSVLMNVGNVENTGGSSSHNNIMPSLVINFIIAIEGLYPTAQ